MRKRIKPSTLIVTLAAIAAIALVVTTIQAGSEPGEPVVAIYWETNYAQNSSATCPPGELCVEWCDLNGGTLFPSGTLCCVSPELAGQQATTCRRPG